jgi:rare lipoprotein A
MASVRSRAGVAISIVLAGAGLAGCARGAPSRESARLAASPKLSWAAVPPRTSGTYKVGNPYQIDGKWYVPAPDPTYDRVGVASWYGSDNHGRATANGETFDMNALTAAHKTLPMPSYVYVTYLDNGRTLLLRLNDRGPFVGDRIIDLSRAAARALGFESTGLGRVRVRYAGPAPLDGDDSRERRFLAAQPWATPRLAGLP